MPWVIGIDEAGYGPNLGPFVQAAVPLRLPDVECSCWETLRSVVRRSHEKADHRLLIDDSKKIYTRGGLEALEHGVHTAFKLGSSTVGDLIDASTIAGVRMKLAGEAWYEAGEAAPVVAQPDGISTATVALMKGQPKGTVFGQPAASIVPAPEFNRICDAGGSKGAVLGLGLVELIPSVLEKLPRDEEPVLIHCDKHGGRNYYAQVLQEVFPNGWIVPGRESAEESRYQVQLLARPVTVIFRPRADGDSLAVALASMLCKYLREVCMRQFNRFWTRHVPGLKPTAGYPGDARRFFEQIQPALARLGMSDDQVWRKR